MSDIIYDEDDLELVIFSKHEKVLEIIMSSMEESEYRSAYLMLSNSLSYRDRELYIYKDIGTVGLFFPEEVDGVCWLSYFAVKKEFRSRGLGSFLLSYILSIAKKRGMDRILVETFSTPIYEDAIELYKKFGFYQIGYMDLYHKNKTCLYFGKLIKAGELY